MDASNTIPHTQKLDSYEDCASFITHDWLADSEWSLVDSEWSLVDSEWSLADSEWSLAG